MICAVALEFLKILKDEKLLENVRERGAELREGLARLVTKFDFIKEIRGEGLMIGMELAIEGGPFVTEAMKRGLLINCTHDYTLRLLPPFLITQTQVREFLRLFETVLSETPREAPATKVESIETPLRAAHFASR
jgi:acetylornithine/succinyldiaminopimelate/putrescine aminotransferase